jgi:hypothetical protein
VEPNRSAITNPRHESAFPRKRLTQCGQVDVDLADFLDDGWQDWALWDETCVQLSEDESVIESAGREAQIVRLDAGRNLGFARIVARRH